MYIERPSRLLNQYASVLEWGITHIDPNLDDHGNFAVPIPGQELDPRNFTAAMNHRIEMRRIFGNPNWSILLKPEDSTHSFRLTQDNTQPFVAFDTTRTRPMDGGFVSIRGLMVCLLVYDNQPVILFDPDRRIVALASASWTNSLGNDSGTVLSNLVYLLGRQFGSFPQELIAYLGPTLCADHNDLPISELARIQDFSRRWGIQPARYQRGQRLHVNLAETNFRLLQRLGVKQIDVDDRCTFETTHLASAKRDDKRLGGPFRPTAAVAVMLKP